MKNIKCKINWPPITLIILSAIIAYLNYEPNTWLTGWDNLHSEFNFAINIKRSIFSVWQEFQGLGLLGGMGHASDLIRELVLLFFQKLGIPNIFLRCLWIFLILPLGPLGVYFFTKNHLLANRFDRQTRQSAAFLGSLFYLLNLATIQHYFVPFETFITFHNFFPWIIYSTILYLKQPSRRHFLFMSSIYLLSAPSYYVETLFIVLCLTLIPIFYYHLRDQHLHRKPILTTVSSILTLFFSQSYWLFPVAFFVATNGQVSQDARVNLITSPETYDRNLAFASLPNLFLLKGYLFNFFALDPNQKFDYLMLNWRNHLSNPIILLIGFTNFITILIGIYYGFKKKLHSSKSLFAIFLICFFFLLGGGLLINNHLPLLGELFRSPFTKFSTPLSFTYAVFFAIGSIFLLDLFSLLHIRFTSYLTLFTISLGLFIFSAPVFSGNLISPLVKRQIPPEYFELFSFFQTQDPNTRIANLPQPGFIGWHFYRWNYQGSGFLWYGINQPILDRNFDVWEKQNEKYYEEITTALYSENQKEFEETLEKYQVTWLLLDKYLISPNNPKALALDKIDQLLTKSNLIKLEKNINNKILIYKYNNNQQTQNFLNLSSSNDPLPKPIYNPNLRPQTNWQIDSKEITLPLNTTSQTINNLTIPSYTETENIVPVSISYRKNYRLLEIEITPLLPKIDTTNLNSTPTSASFSLPEDESGFILQLNNQFLELQTPSELSSQDDFLFLTTTYLPTRESTTISLYSNNSLSTTDLMTFLINQQPKTCYIDKPNRHIEKITSKNSITLIGTDVVGCLSLPLQTTNDLLSVSFQHSSPTNTSSHANITNEEMKGLPSNPTPSYNQSQKQSRLFSPGESKNLQLNLILEANETKTPQEITYSNVTLSTHALLESQNIFLKPIKAQKFKLQNQNPKISLPIIDSPQTIHFLPLDNTLFPESRNCNPVNNGNFDKTIKPDSITYTAKNASTCDFANFPYLPHNTSYALILKHQYFTGLPLSVCFENYTTKRCDLYEKLPKNQKTETVSIISPIINPKESYGYSLHLINDSFSQYETKNTLSDLLITPFPLNFLKNITTNSSSTTETSRSTAVLSPESHSGHPAEFLYLATLRSPEQGRMDEVGQTLNLYQTQSPYWKALEISETDLKLPLWSLILKLPYLYLTSNRLTMNRDEVSGSWHNSWSVNPGNHHLAIVYLPQYLQFFGFTLLPLIPILILIHPSSRPKKHTTKHFTLFKRKTKKPH